MTSFYLHVGRLKDRQCNRRVIVLMLIFLGVAFFPADCLGQAVPSRNQSQILTRPIVRPPEPPLEKEIRETRQEVRDNKVVLERKIAAQRLFANYIVRRQDSEKLLQCYMEGLKTWALLGSSEENACEYFRKCNEKYHKERVVNTIKDCVRWTTSEWDAFMNYEYNISTMQEEGRN